MSRIQYDIKNTPSTGVYQFELDMEMSGMKVCTFGIALRVAMIDSGVFHSRLCISLNMPNRPPVYTWTTKCPMQETVSNPLIRSIRCDIVACNLIVFTPTEPLTLIITHATPFRMRMSLVS